MTYIMVDVEADGPTPGLYSMIEIGAVVVDREMNKTFHGKLYPITGLYLPKALEVTGYTRMDTEKFPDPEKTMKGFDVWVRRMANGTFPVFISDNNGFDWAFVNYYFWKYLNSNPFGHSSNNLANVFGGLHKRVRTKFRHLRKTPHTHNPVDDAKGNVEAMLRMVNEYGLEIW
jgi:DNA polymerase III epsilon subunit-like protein